MNGRTPIILALTAALCALWLLLAYCFRRSFDLAHIARRKRLIWFLIAAFTALPLAEIPYYSYCFGEHRTFLQQFVANLPLFSAVMTGWCWSMIRNSIRDRRGSV